MERHYSVNEISADLDISVRRVYTICKKLAIDPKEIGDDERQLLEEAFADNKKMKKLSADFKAKPSGKQTLSISALTSSTIEERLADAKQKFDNINKSLAEYQMAIDTYGEVIVNEKNSQPFSNPIRKAMNETLKQYNTLQKTINELEEKLKLTAGSVERAIDD